MSQRLPTPGATSLEGQDWRTSVHQRVSSGVVRARARWMVDLQDLQSRLQTFLLARCTLEPVPLPVGFSPRRPLMVLGMAGAEVLSQRSVGPAPGAMGQLTFVQLQLPAVDRGFVMALSPRFGRFPCCIVEVVSTPSAITLHAELLSKAFVDPEVRNQFTPYLADLSPLFARTGGAVEPPTVWKPYASGLGISATRPCEYFEELCVLVLELLDRTLSLPPLIPDVTEPLAHSELLPNRQRIMRNFGAEWTAQLEAHLVAPPPPNFSPHRLSPRAR